MQAFTTDDIYLHRELQALDGSARSPVALFVASRARRSGTYASTVWCLDTGDTRARARRMTTSVSSATSPRLSPDTSHIAFLSSRGEDSGPQVQVLRMNGGEASRRSQSKRTLKRIEMWAPDGSALLLTAEVDWAEDDRDDPSADNRPMVATFLPYKQDGSGFTIGKRTLLLRIDAESGDETVLASGDFNVTEAQWSPDGGRLAYVRSGDGRQRHRSALWTADADGGNARLRVGTLASISGIRWSPDGSTLAFAGSEAEGDSMSQLWVVPADDGEPRSPVGDALELEGSHLAWHPDGKRVAVVTARRGLTQVAVVDVANGASEVLTRGLRHVLAMCAAGERLMFVSATMRNPCEIFSIGWDGDDERRHTAFNRKWARSRARPRVRLRSFRVPDGRDGEEKVHAWLLLPAEGDGPFPLLLDLHGGPQSIALIDFANHMYWYQLLSRGWAILAPNAVGSSSYGTDFARRLRGRWGELDLPQHHAILDQLQSEGVADARIACAGKSYGGFLSAYAVSRGSRFKAAVVSAPVANVESHAGTSDSGYYVSPYAMDGDLITERERYQCLSPTNYSSTIDTPTLVLQGADDQRCPVGQAEEFFCNLVRYSKAPCKMVVYPGGSHTMAASGNPQHRGDYHARMAGWVQEWVGE